MQLAGGITAPIGCITLKFGKQCSRCLSRRTGFTRKLRCCKSKNNKPHRDRNPLLLLLLTPPPLTTSPLGQVDSVQQAVTGNIKTFAASLGTELAKHGVIAAQYSNKVSVTPGVDFSGGGLGAGAIIGNFDT